MNRQHSRRTYMRFQSLHMTACMALAMSLFARFGVAAVPQAATDLRLVDAAMIGDRVAVQGLLQQKADINRAHGDGTTALHWAVLNNDLEMVQMLVQAKADVNATSRFDAITPLYLAATNGNSAIIEVLIGAGADVNKASGTGTTPLMRSAAS